MAATNLEQYCFVSKGVMSIVKFIENFTKRKNTDEGVFSQGGYQ